jgi:hypothetical protein
MFIETFLQVHAGRGNGARPVGVAANPRQWAAEIKLRAQRRIGEISASLETQKNQVARPTGGTSKTAALSEVGISRSTAHRYEQLAAIPDDAIEAYVAESKDAYALLRFAGRARP